MGVQFRNEQFFRRARPHKGLRRDVLNVRRSRKAAENAARRKKGHFWMDTNEEKQWSIPFSVSRGIELRI